MMKSPQVKEHPTSAEEALRKRKRSAGSDPEGATDNRPPAPTPTPAVSDIPRPPASIPTPAVSDILSHIKTEAPSAAPVFQALSTMLASLQLPSISLSSLVTLDEDGDQAGPRQVGL